MAAFFAGSRRNAGLGRFVASEAGLLPCRRAHRRHRMSRGRRGRERRPHGLFEAHAPGARSSELVANRPMTRPSLGPLTRARRSPRKLRRHRPAKVARSRRHRGRASLARARNNRHRGLHERIVCGSPRVTASAGRVGVMRKTRKGVTAPVPARIVRARAQCPFVEFVAEVGRRRQASNTLVKRAPKRAARGE